MSRFCPSALPSAPRPVFHPKLNQWLFGAYRLFRQRVHRRFRQPAVDFPGGMPFHLDIPNPEVIYNTPGQYTVQLTLFWLEGKRCCLRHIAITYWKARYPGSPSASIGLAATFTNLSTLATSYTWDFGDGTGSNEENPVHAFPVFGAYEVTLLVSNGICTDTTSFGNNGAKVRRLPSSLCPNRLCAPVCPVQQHQHRRQRHHLPMVFPGGSPPLQRTGRRS